MGRDKIRENGDTQTERNKRTDKQGQEKKDIYKETDR